MDEGYPKSIRSGVNFTDIFTHSFCACRFQKRKKTDDLSVFFTLLGSARIKVVRRTLVKLSPGIVKIFTVTVQKT
jgi:hypothetical protein